VWFFAALAAFGLVLAVVGLLSFASWDVELVLRVKVFVIGFEGSQCSLIGLTNYCLDAVLKVKPLLAI
jgi:hypothetical protein